MKIQYFGQDTFQASFKDTKIVFNPHENFTEKNLDFTTNSDGKIKQKIESKKHLYMPGEYEISGVLVRSVSSQGNILFKVVIEDFTILHCGNMTETPDKKSIEELGEDIDVLIINVSQKFPAKKIKEFIENIDPRIAFIGGDEKFFPEVRSNIQIQSETENPFNISKSTISDQENSFYYILSI